jgi:hypothetical protein
MSSYNDSLTADITGLMSGVKLAWQASPSNSATVVSQSIYYTDQYVAGDGSVANEFKELVMLAGDTSATIMELTSDREYTFTLKGTDDADPQVVFNSIIKATPNQPPHAPVFTLVGGNGKAEIIVTNHRTATTHYEIHVNGNGFDGSAGKETTRTIALSGGNTNAGPNTWTYTLNHLTNSTANVTYEYEVAMQATTSVATSPMSSGSHSVSASSRLAVVSGINVTTGFSMGNYDYQGVLKFQGANNPTPAQQYYWKAFPEGTSDADMIANSTNQPATWNQASNHAADYIFNANIEGLDLDTVYRFAVVPATIAEGRSHLSLASVEAQLSGLPGTTGITMAVKTGIDISNGLDPMDDSDMSGKLQLRYSMTEAQFQALDNGSDLTDLFFDISASDGSFTADVSLNANAKDLSNGIINVTSLTNGVDYKVRARTQNLNGVSAFSAFTAASTVSTKPSNLALTAIPLNSNDTTGQSPYLANGAKLFDIDADASGNGDPSLTFTFDVSGVGNTMKKEGLTKAQVNALTLVLGKKYEIDAKVTNANGKQVTTSGIVIRPSAPPSVKGSTFAQTQIDISSASITEVTVNLANMQREDYGYTGQGALVQLVYDDTINGDGNTFESQVQEIGSGIYTNDINFALPDFVSGAHHTHFKLRVTPFNAVYPKGYTVATTAPDGYTLNVMGLNTFTTPVFSVVTASAGLSNLTNVSASNDMDKSLKFQWKSSIAGDKVELLVARAQIHTDRITHTGPAYADYKLIGEMTTTKYDSAVENYMTYELSGNSVTLADATTMSMVNGDKYYFMVRDKDYPMRGQLTADGIPYGLPIISDMKLQDYNDDNTTDLVTFKINPNGAALSALFMIDNLSNNKYNTLSGLLDNETRRVGDIYFRVSASEAAGFNYTSQANSNNLYVNIVSGNPAGISLGTAVSSVTDQLGNLTPTAIWTAANSASSELDIIEVEALAKREAINLQSGNANGTADSVTNKSPADLKYDEILVLKESAQKALADAQLAKTRGLQYTIPNGEKSAQQCLADAQTIQQQLNNMLVAA